MRLEAGGVRKLVVRRRRHRFNSKLVRLEVDALDKERLFDTCFNSKLVRLEVTRHYITLPRSKSFNSKLVRLEVTQIYHYFLPHYRFNSKLVRLEVKVGNIVIGLLKSFYSKKDFPNEKAGKRRE